ncbi:MAG: transglutaminase-like domain-containing protein [Syntrophothermus sp.]
MEKAPNTTRWWDWASLALLFVLLEIVASRLVATSWTPYLYLAQTSTYLAFVVGVALGYSRFSRRLSQWLSAIFMVLMLPLQWTLMIDQNVSLEGQFTSVAGRLFFSTSDFLARRPVEDPLFFVVIMTLAFWFISSWAGFALVRDQNYLAAVLPCAIGFMTIQAYDRNRLWILAVFAFMALLLLGRLHYLQNKEAWHKRRILLSPDTGVELTSSMVVAAGLLILVSWTLPSSISSWQSATRTWDKLTKPWRTFTQNMENAVSALESPSGSKRGEFYGSELPLGSGWPLSDSVMFTVKAPDIPSDQRPPRYYWRGRSYDYFVNGQWYSTGTVRSEYSPEELNPVSLQSTTGQTPAHFMFHTGDASLSLLYSPTDPVRVDHPGVTCKQGTDIVAWHAFPWLKSGETYAVDVFLKNPNLQQLRDAGTNYPDWVSQKYLELPKSFSPKITQLAKDLTADAPTPYDKASAITQYLRDNIEYAATVPNPPRNADRLEWFLFNFKKGFCVYYASSEVAMLRSLGIPARMAVGFAQGDKDGNDYTVRRLHAHAWPEVYFPDIGWVEFEPTASQPALSRPLPPSDPNQLDSATPRNNSRRDDAFAGKDQSEDPGITPTAAAVEKQISPLLYLIPLFIAAAALFFFLNRRFLFTNHVPVLVRTTFERSGLVVPRWILDWENWVGLSQIEKAFESINFGLRTLDGQTVPVHNTPGERARKLSFLLPQMSEQIKLLLDEHQTYLYTSRVANDVQARQAAFNIRKQVIVERFRYLLFGKPIRD